MASRRRVELAGLNELFERISSGRFEQPKDGVSRRLRLSLGC
jgi:hypothetical protein